MDLIEVHIDQNRVATFDGRVLEIFGGSVRRFHVKLLTASVSGPDKHGIRTVTLVQASIDNDLPLHEAAFESFQPILDALKDAGVNVTA